MNELLTLCVKLAPRLIDTIQTRYNILRHVYHTQPAGRRALAAALGMTERVMRAELTFLVEQGLLGNSPRGVTVTADGEGLLIALHDYMHTLQGLDELEHRLASVMQVKRVVITPGDSRQSVAARKELGKAAAAELAKNAAPGAVIAVSGGTTMADVAAAARFSCPGATVVPSRGGLGEQVAYQANTAAATLAARLGAHYRPLYVPDGLADEALDVIMRSDANVRFVVDTIKNAHVLLHGIGRAEVMAARRGVTPARVESMTAQGAVGEALGYYYDINGQVVFATDSIGLDINDTGNIRTVIAVAGGGDKAAAIVAVMRSREHVRPAVTLVIDEAAARAMLVILNSGN